MKSYFYDIIAKVVAAQRFLALALLPLLGNVMKRAAALLFMRFVRTALAPKNGRYSDELAVRKMLIAAISHPSFDHLVGAGDIRFEPLHAVNRYMQ